MSTARMYAVAVVCAGGFVVHGAALAAAESFAQTPQETAMCNALVWGGMDKVSRLKLEGEEKWGHTHHYCDCIRFRHRALNSLGVRHQVKYNLEIAIGGCDYVLNRIPQNHFLRAKVHVDKGRALKLKGEVGAAVQEFMKAIQSDPHEVNAYIELSEVERSGGQAKQALETITQGLRQNPGAQSLQKSYLSLGGKEPFPGPIEVTKTESAAGVPDLGKVAPDGYKLPSDDAAQVSDGVAVSVQPPVDQGALVPGRTCRFCPPEQILKRWGETFAPDREVGEAAGKQR